jgi:hypothetical protein
MKKKRLLVLRKEQEEAMYYGQFENWMIGHLNEFFPETCEELGKRGVREEIRFGIKRAAQYGIKEGQELCNYINLMMAFGCDFDINPEFPWAESILNDNQITSPVDRMKRLLKSAKEQLRRESLNKALKPS